MEKIIQPVPGQSSPALVIFIFLLRRFASIRATPEMFAACKAILSVTNGAIYICMSSSALHVLQSAFARAGGHWSTFIIWAKHTFTLGRADYQRQYEPILYGWPEGKEHHWCGQRLP